MAQGNSYKGVLCEETQMMLHDDLRDGKSQYKVPEVSWSLSHFKEGCRVYRERWRERVLEGFEQQRHKPRLHLKAILTLSRQKGKSREMGQEAG